MKNIDKCILLCTSMSIYKHYVTYVDSSYYFIFYYLTYTITCTLFSFPFFDIQFVICHNGPNWMTRFDLTMN